MTDKTAKQVLFAQYNLEHTINKGKLFIWHKNEKHVINLISHTKQSLIDAIGRIIYGSK